MRPLGVVVGPLGFEGGLLAIGRNFIATICYCSAAFFPFFVLSVAKWLGDDKHESRSQMSSMRRQRYSHGRRTDRGKMLKVSWSWSYCLSSRCKVPSMWPNQSLERLETSNTDRSDKATLLMFRVRPSVYREISSLFPLFFAISTWRFIS